MNLGAAIVGAAACGTFLDTSSNDDEQTPAPAATGTGSGTGTADASLDGSGPTTTGTTAECELPKRVSTACAGGVCFPDLKCHPPRGLGESCETGWQCETGLLCAPAGNSGPGSSVGGRCEVGGCIAPRKGGALSKDAGNSSGTVGDPDQDCNAGDVCCLGQVCGPPGGFNPRRPEGCSTCSTTGMSCLDGAGCCDGYHCAGDDACTPDL